MIILVHLLIGMKKYKISNTITSEATPFHEGVLLSFQYNAMEVLGYIYTYRIVSMTV